MGVVRRYDAAEILARQVARIKETVPTPEHVIVMHKLAEEHGVENYWNDKHDNGPLERSCPVDGGPIDAETGLCAANNHYPVHERLGLAANNTNCTEETLICVS